jgi:hypothetical protein
LRVTKWNFHTALAHAQTNSTKEIPTFICSFANK